MKFATWDNGGLVTAGIVGEHGLHALPPGVTVLDLVRAGLPGRPGSGDGGAVGAGGACR